MFLNSIYILSLIENNTIASFILRSQIASYLRSFSFICLSSVTITRFTITRFFDDVLVGNFRLCDYSLLRLLAFSTMFWWTTSDISIVILICCFVIFIRISGYPDFRNPADDPGNIRVPGIPGSGYPENANTSFGYLKQKKIKNQNLAFCKKIILQYFFK